MEVLLKALKYFRGKFDSIQISMTLKHELESSFVLVKINILHQLKLKLK